MAMTLEQLNAVVETVDKGSFKQASYRLGKHTSTVSGLIANLEAELGLTLFERKPRSLDITPHGLELYDYAVSVTRECEHLDIKASSLLEGLPTTLSIAVDATVQGPEVAKVLTQLMEKFPALELKVLTCDPMQVRSNVLTHQADIGFGVNLFSGNHELTLADGFSFNVVCIASPTLNVKEQIVSLDKIRGQKQVAALFMK
ncbi:LysR family transcriptional regulator [Vibrio tapetis subsp. quintayensis]|uniref:LysR family transcriptional regulator n=1 Tax=Vibrio tapetis TaxID=52443 RepID=UPI0025B45F22|nr:LysR family transcriptional regulator [Vibrio tapetis]MDN3681937.1 LysR family transcriptional regulator [Vibrio tapetis subsp. quintayensis]